MVFWPQEFHSDRISFILLGFASEQNRFFNYFGAILVLNYPTINVWLAGGRGAGS